MAAGYSHRTLTQKLGIKPNSSVIILNAPDEYGHLLFPFPEGCSIFDELKEKADLIQYFTKSTAEIESVFPKLKSHLNQDGSLWISWPKGSSKMKTDVNETIIQKLGLENGLVDVKVIAVDKTWSGLKFVFRVKDRKPLN